VFRGENAFSALEALHFPVQLGGNAAANTQARLSSNSAPFHGLREFGVKGIFATRHPVVFF
jgi:hypothetical protein